MIIKLNYELLMTNIPQNGWTDLMENLLVITEGVGTPLVYLSCENLLFHFLVKGSRIFIIPICQI